MGEHGTEEEDNYGRSTGNGFKVLCFLYGLILVILSIVFPMASFLEAQAVSGTVYLTVLNVYINAVSFIILIVLQGQIACNGKEIVIVPVQGKMKLALRDDNDIRLYEVENTEENGKKEVEEEDDELPFDQPPLALAGEGASLYSRLGALAFGTGFMVLDVFRLTQFWEEDNAMECLGVGYIVQAAIRLLNIFIIMFFIFKNHRIVINQHHKVVLFSMIHLIAGNLCNWAISVIVESAEGIIKGSSSGAEHRRRRASDPSDHSTSSNSTSGDHGNSGGHGDGGLNCHFTTTLAAQMGPYLFPLAIEFSLVAAATLYGITMKIGHKIELEDFTEGVNVEQAQGGCVRSHKGLFAGLLVLVLTMACLCCYYLLEEMTGSLGVIISMYCYAAIVFCTIIAIIFAAVKMSKLKVMEESEGAFDLVLVVIASVGVYLYYGFQAIPAVEKIDQEGTDGHFFQLSVIQLVLCIVVYIETTMQIALIADGFSRKPYSAKQQYIKPGRTFLVFILIANLCLWCCDTFLATGLNESVLHSDFYGDTAWPLIVYIARPLAIFFRFHSSVCIADIWSHSFSMHVEFNKISGKKAEIKL